MTRPSRDDYGRGERVSTHAGGAEDCPRVAAVCAMSVAMSTAPTAAPREVRDTHLPAKFTLSCHAP